MYRLDLTGLAGDTPIGFMAALGLLHLGEQLALPQPLRLGWNPAQGWTAQLATLAPLSLEALIAALQALTPTLAQSPLLALKDARMPPEDYCRVYADSDTATRRLLAAYGSPAVLTNKGDAIRTTAYYMISGQQTFSTTLRREALERHLLPRRKGDVAAVTARWQETLLGPWQRGDDLHMLGWDQQGNRQYAYEAADPSEAVKNGMAAALVLAYHALPFFPTWATATGKLRTLGYRQGKDGETLTWPLWETPLTADAVRTLVALPALLEQQPEPTELQAYGIGAVFRCRKIEAGGQGRMNFGAAMPVA